MGETPAGTPLDREQGHFNEISQIEPYISPTDNSVAEFTWRAVLAGSALGIVFAASSLYLVLKVGMTVSASIPIAVLSISLFRGLGRLFRLRGATILENNMVQTVGSAGESIAFGVGVTMPALMLLGYEMDIWRIMTVGVLGGLLGILMMIPLRRALIVQQHSQLPFPEGTACAAVLLAGERGGSSAATVFTGFGLAFVYKLLTNPFAIFRDTANWNLFQIQTNGKTIGLHKGVLGGEFTPELLGVGYIIGPRIAGITFAGGVLAYLVIAPAIALFGEQLTVPLYPSEVVLIRDMDESSLRSFYILYIGAGAVATGGIISMARSLPAIATAVVSGLRDLSRGSQIPDGHAVARQNYISPRRTDQDIPMRSVLVGSLLLVLLLAGLPKVGLGFTPLGLLGSLLIVVFGFLFVTVSARLTGEIGSSSNPISGMTVATLLLTCLIFLLLQQVDRQATLLALTIAAVVCVASSNGGTTAQDLKTGHLIGATPLWQQYGILIGALTSALVLGATLYVLNQAGTHYTKLPQHLPAFRVPNVSDLHLRERPGRPYADDQHDYRILWAAEGQFPGVQPGKYLVDDQGTIRYLVDPAINGRFRYLDADAEKIEATQDATQRAAAESQSTALPKYDAPKTRLMAFIIDGILHQKLPWSLVLIGVLTAIAMELAGVASLPFAVGIYLPIQTSFPIFLGGIVRWTIDHFKKNTDSTDSSPSVLLSSGLIAGGALAGVSAACLRLAPDGWHLTERLNLGPTTDRWFNQFIAHFSNWNSNSGLSTSRWPTLIAFSVLVIAILLAGLRSPRQDKTR
ncbi:MAG: oligopeptide transporter, OPT family [Planctomycetota bacterium]|nr:oligopeptide transporter, OPT family [Planctomycetota bacterium]MDA1179651.1 oligopeptide transporter, OPT family [Planctomycetota bacterium]